MAGKDASAWVPQVEEAFLAHINARPADELNRLLFALGRLVHGRTVHGVHSDVPPIQMALAKFAQALLAAEQPAASSYVRRLRRARDMYVALMGPGQVTVETLDLARFRTRVADELRGVGIQALALEQRPPWKKAKTIHRASDSCPSQLASVCPTPSVADVLTLAWSLRQPLRVDVIREPGFMAHLENLPQERRDHRSRLSLAMLHANECTGYMASSLHVEIMRELRDGGDLAGRSLSDYAQHAIDCMAASFADFRDSHRLLEGDTGLTRTGTSDDLDR
jgi:hypothetical protein